MRVLQVIGTLKIGGAEEMAVSWGETLLKNNITMDYLVWVEGDDYVSRVNKFGNVLQGCNPNSHPIKFYNLLKKYHKKYKYDVIHINTLLSAGIISLIAKMIGIKKIVVHSHNTQNAQKKGFVAGVYEKLSKFLIKKCGTDFLACGNEAGEYLFGKKLYKEKGIFIYNGINSDKYEYNDIDRISIRKELGISDDCLLLGSISRLSVAKNLVYILDICKRLKERNVEFKYLMVGDGEDYQLLLNKINELELNDNVIMYGKSNNTPPLYSAMDIFLVPSLFEGLPVSIVEAQCSGINMIISNLVTQSSKVADNVVFLPLDSDCENWINTILKMSENKERKNWIKGTIFDREVSCLDLLNVYEK